jgi:hypothetical protein
MARHVFAAILLASSAVLLLSACGVENPADQVASPSSTVSPPASPSPSPTLATPGPGISSEFLAFVDTDAFYVEPAPAGASPTISQADAVTLAQNFPPTNRVVNGSMLGECVSVGQGNTPTKSYLCWVIDGTSHEPDPLSQVGPLPGSTATPGPATTIFPEYFVIVDAQPGSATAGTIVFAGG